MRDQDQSSRGPHLTWAESRFGETTIIPGGAPVRIKVSGLDTRAGLSVFAYEGKAPGGPPLHVHDAQDEIYIVLKGRYLFELGGERRLVEAGGSIFLPRGVPHSFAQLGDEGEMVFMFTPAGRMEDYFRALAALEGPPAPEAAAALFADHGMRLVGPPISLDAQAVP